MVHVVRPGAVESGDFSGLTRLANQVFQGIHGGPFTGSDLLSTQQLGNGCALFRHVKKAFKIRND